MTGKADFSPEECKTVAEGPPAPQAEQSAIDEVSAALATADAQ